jgi:hypothetical protein
VQEIIDSTARVDTPGRIEARKQQQQQAHMVAVTVGPLVAGERVAYMVAACWLGMEALTHTLPVHLPMWDVHVHSTLIN